MKVGRIADHLRNRGSTEPIKLKKKAVSHKVPRQEKNRTPAEALDISDLDEILEINLEEGYCVAESGATFEKIVDAASKYNLMPLVVPELKTITIGGAVSGCSLESMSYRFGGFHDTCLEYEVITAQGDILTCTPDNENQLLFQMLHGTFGTLGIITRIKFRLIPSKKFVKVNYESFDTISAYLDAIWSHYKQGDFDFMDGIIHSSSHFILSLGNLVDEAPYSNNYDWMKIYYQSTASRKEDYLLTKDYFYRYHKGVTNVYPKSFVGRLLFGKVINSTSTLKLAHSLKNVIPKRMIPITVDTFIPYSRMEEFMEWHVENVDHFPLWCVPYKVVRKYEWIDEKYAEEIDDELFIDIAIYGMKRSDPDHYYKMIEKKLTELNAIKTLISTNFYTEEEFWKIWNKENYYKIKQQTDPGNVFRDLYEKTCRS